ncbi:hypothetical protein KBB96_04985 [Luteolibacter ambystomatis]|uniref:Uncharacterized protein n=1 Tax=Luteolibacter ambystomatis TaxID=2824561 RepID=A0A975J1G9_9BACT|nr:hypothetical protein [Luteolibacter ambystomatis]QUE52247.1 hypothetical protein KBB96_04985 [Luteolibacter ambystomatis]
MNEGLANWLTQQNDLRESFSEGDGTLVSADFGQDDPKTRFQVYTFLVVPSHQLRSWAASIEDFRSNVYKGSGSFEFKKVDDPHRLKVLPDFLGRCAMIRGYTLTLLVPREIRWAFPRHGSKKGVPDSLLRDTVGLVAKPHIAEKVLRILHGVIGVLSSLPKVGRALVLHIDRDAAVNDVTRFIELMRGLVKVNLDSDSEVEEIVLARDEGSKGRDGDLLCIPDLVCGAVSEIHNRANGVPHIPSAKAARVISWMNEDNASLKHLVLQYRLEMISGSEHARWLRICYADTPPSEA